MKAITNTEALGETVKQVGGVVQIDASPITTAGVMVKCHGDAGADGHLVREGIVEVGLGFEDQLVAVLVFQFRRYCRGSIGHESGFCDGEIENRLVVEVQEEHLAQDPVEVGAEAQAQSLEAGAGYLKCIAADRIGHFLSPIGIVERNKKPGSKGQSERIVGDESVGAEDLDLRAQE